MEKVKVLDIAVNFVIKHPKVKTAMTAVTVGAGVVAVAQGINHPELARTFMLAAVSDMVFADGLAKIKIPTAPEK